MFHKILFAGVILTMVGLGMAFHHFSQTADLTQKYQKLGLIQSDFEYEKVEKTWGEQGLIFYQIRFPFINTPLYADKMNIHLSDTGMNLKLKNAHIKVIEGLKNIYGSEIAENLNKYVPYKNFLNQILTTFAIMGIDEFIGDITVNTVYNDVKTMQFTVDMFQKNQPTIQITGIIHIPIVGAHQISDLWNGKIDSVEIKVEESFFNRYISYAKSKKFKLPENIKNGLFQLNEKERLPECLKNIFK